MVISQLVRNIRSFGLMLKVKQSNMDKYKRFSVTSFWDKEIQQLKQVPFGEELDAGIHIL